MKRILFAFLLICVCGTAVLASVPNRQMNFATRIVFLEIHPRAVNQLLHIAALGLNISHGQARQRYNNGTLTITPVTINGDQFYMLDSEGWCILAALEDRL